MAVLMVGDWVEVSNRGKNYSTYDEFFDVFCPSLKSRYKREPDKYEVGQIIFSHYHQDFRDTMIYVVQNKIGDVMLIGEGGLTKLSKREIANNNIPIIVPSRSKDGTAIFKREDVEDWE